MKKLILGLVAAIVITFTPVAHAERKTVLAGECTADQIEQGKCKVKIKAAKPEPPPAPPVVTPPPKPLPNLTQAGAKAAAVVVQKDDRSRWQRMTPGQKTAVVVVPVVVAAAVTLLTLGLTGHLDGPNSAR